MAIKVTPHFLVLTLLRSSELKPQHQTQFTVKLRTPIIFRRPYPSERDSVNINPTERRHDDNDDGDDNSKRKYFQQNPFYQVLNLFVYIPIIV